MKLRTITRGIWCKVIDLRPQELSTILENSQSDLLGGPRSTKSLMENPEVNSEAPP